MLTVTLAGQKHPVVVPSSEFEKQLLTEWAQMGTIYSAIAVVARCVPTLVEVDERTGRGVPLAEHYYDLGVRGSPLRFGERIAPLMDAQGVSVSEIIAAGLAVMRACRSAVPDMEEARGNSEPPPGSGTA